MGSEVEGLIAGEMVPRTIVTPRDDIVPLLFEPALSWCTEYRRAVGYFSSAWIARNAVGLARLASRGGVAKWVTSPHLSEDDWLALTRHTADAGSLLERAVLNDVEKLAQVLEEDTRNTIGWMVYDGLLQFKIAVPAAGNRHTDFHSKFGIFLLEGSPVVAFIGLYLSIGLRKSRSMAELRARKGDWLTLPVTSTPDWHLGRLRPYSQA